MDTREAVYRFAVALAIGVLIGIDRERKRFRSGAQPAPLPAGVRTFALIGLLGCSSAFLGGQFGASVFAAALVGFAALVVAMYVLTGISGELGATTEVAALITFALGAMAWSGEVLLAGAVAVAMAVVLAARERLHGFAKRVEPDDLRAALTLAVVTVIVLPLLPDRLYGPYEAWNPYRIWLLVVFISSLGFAGYVGIKVLGPGRGIALAGLLGGVVSSTAATLSFSGRSKESPELGGACACAIALAWAAMFVRVLVEVAVVNAELLPRVGPPIAAAAGAGALGAGVLLARARRSGPTAEGSSYTNPFSLVSAMKFGAFFAAILLIAKLAQVHLQDAGVLATAGIAGLVDVDAITLSMARLATRGELTEETASLAVLIAVAANTLVKALVAAWIGSASLRRTLLPIAALTLVAGAVVSVALR